MCCILCRGISPEPATKHVTFEAVVEDASPRHLLFKGVFTKGTLVDGVTVANTRHACCPVLSCPVPWMPQSSSTMGQAQLCQPGRRAGVPCVDHADTMHTDD